MKTISRKNIFKKKISVREQATLARRLVTLLKAGISLPEAFSFVAKSFSKKKSLHFVFVEIIQKVTVGRQCSTALEDAGIFDPSFIHLVRIGERSGSIEDALMHAALMLERRDDISKKVTGVMIYPAFITCATLGIATFLVMYIFPKIIPLVTSMNIPLPLLTRLLMLLSGLLIHYWLEIGIGFGIFFVCTVVAWKKLSGLREAFRRILFSCPLVGNMYKGYILIGIFNSLGLLLEHGETLPTTLSSMRDSIPYTEFKKTIDVAIHHVNRGGLLSESFRQQRLFPAITVDLIETGERTGGIASACTTIARIYESETDEMIQRISRVIEPVLMLGMGGVVGSIALSIVMPIYEITNHLNH